MPNQYQKNLLRAKDLLGGVDNIGLACGFTSGRTIHNWLKKGRPPYTEYTGQTRYAYLISEATNGAIKPTELIPLVNRGNGQEAA